MGTPADVNLSEYIGEIPDFPKPGILFRDITPLLACPLAFRQAIRTLAERVRDRGAEVIVAAEARGFLLAAPLALELGLSLVPIRKPGKLPGETVSHTYELEYGQDSLHIRTDAIRPGARVLVVDDLLATGGTVEACCRLVEKVGGKVIGCAFLIELAGLKGAQRIAAYDPIVLIRYEGC